LLRRRERHQPEATEASGEPPGDDVGAGAPPQSRDQRAEPPSVASDFQAANPDGTLADFLERVSLVADSDQLPPSADLEDEEARQAEEQGQITLMTVHTAKGLEFRKVLLFDVSKNAIPRPLRDQQYSDADSDDALLRERSLLYVAATRARDQLAISWSGEASPLITALAP